MQIIAANDSSLSSINDLDNLVIGNYSRKEYLKKSIINGNCYAALLNDHIVGFIIFDTAFFENAFIWLVIVDPKYRRQGIAKALIQHVRAICPTQKLFTSTNESNIVMRSLCESLGFVNSGIIENLDEGDPEIVYYLDIKRSTLVWESVTIQKTQHLNFSDISHLVNESLIEGFHHLKRLVDEYQNGTNRFERQGEALFVAYYKELIVGICGLNQDPYSEEKGIGRVRRLYISNNYRRLGIGKLLMHEVIKEAENHYSMIALKTDNPAACKFYNSLGFTENKTYQHISHFLQLKK